MSELSDIARRLQSIDLIGLFDKALSKQLPQIEKFNRQQLNEGIRADGTSMPSHSKSPMSEIYIDNKIERGVYDQSIYPSMNFYYKGNFHRGIKAQMTLFDIEIESTDSKANELEELGGQSIYGNTEENLDKSRKEILDETLEMLNNKIKGT